MEKLRKTLSYEGGMTSVAQVEHWVEKENLVGQIMHVLPMPSVLNVGEEIDITPLQGEIAEWARRNFPSETGDTCLLGVVEEVGELCHIELKSRMGIRYEESELRPKELDAVGDIVIFLMAYCNHRGINLASTVLNVWQEVKQRDWQKYPKNGRDA